MILFPYASDIDYSDGELSLVLQLFNRTKTTDIGITIGLDDDLSKMIEDLLNEKEEV